MCIWLENQIMCFFDSKRNRNYVAIHFSKPEGWEPCSRIVLKHAEISSKACTHGCPAVIPFQMGSRSCTGCSMLFNFCSVAQQVGVKAHLFPNSGFQGLAGRNGFWIYFSPIHLLLFKNLHLFCHIPPAWLCFARQSYDVHHISFFCLTDIHTMLLSSPLWEMLRMASDTPLHFHNLSIKFPH